MAIIKLTTIKEFSYRGVAEQYSNSYHLSGTQPADSAAWTTLANAVVAAEKLILPADVAVVGWYGYNAGSWESKPTKADFLGTYPSTNLGTAALTSSVKGPGDSAMTIRWGTDVFTQNGKRIYLRKYFHPAYLVNIGGDTINASWITLANTFAAKFHDGTSFGGSLRLCRNNGDLATSHLAMPFATTRTLKKRSKRNPT